LLEGVFRDGNGTFFPARAIHTHTVLPGGGWLLPERQRFIVLTGDQWLDKQQLMEAFREALLGHLERAAGRGKLVFAGEAASRGWRLQVFVQGILRQRVGPS